MALIKTVITPFRQTVTYFKITDENISYHRKIAVVVLGAWISRDDRLAHPRKPTFEYHFEWIKSSFPYTHEVEETTVSYDTIKKMSEWIDAVDG